MKGGCRLTIGTLVAFVLLLLWSAWHDLTGYEFGINEESPQLNWLPPEARNVTFYSDWITKSAQFSIDERSMMNWAASIERPLERITEETAEDCTVPTSRDMLEHIGAMEPLPKPTTEQEGINWLQSRRKGFEVGDLYYSLTWKNGGGYWIGYDVSEGVGYYLYAHH